MKKIINNNKYFKIIERDYFKIPVFINLLNFLYKKNPPSIIFISKKLNITYCYVHKIINILIKNGYIIKDNSKKNHIIKLTEKGIYFSKLCYEIVNIIEKDIKNK